MVEISNSEVHWMEPRDLALEEALAGVDPESGCVMFGPHSAYANVSFVDGSCDVLPNDVAPELLKAALTADGGETVDGKRIDFWAKRRAEAARRRRTHRLAVVALLLSIALLVGRPCLKTALQRRAS